MIELSGRGLTPGQKERAPALPTQRPAATLSLNCAETGHGWAATRRSALIVSGAPGDPACVGHGRRIGGNDAFISKATAYYARDASAINAEP